MNKIIKSDIDKSNMQEAIASFPSQIAESFANMKNWSPIREYTGIQNILILGMGGSAIAGDVVSVIAKDHCLVPIIINRSYTIPNWVDSNTLIKFGYTKISEDVTAVLLI